MVLLILPSSIFAGFKSRTVGTMWKVSKYGVISGPYFPRFGLNTDQK